MLKIILIFLSSYALSSYAIAGSPIPNFQSVKENKVYRGGRTSQDGIFYLKSIGIRTIVNLQGGDGKNPIYGDFIEYWQPGENPGYIQKSKRLAEKIGIQYLHAPLNSFEQVSDDDDQLISNTLKAIHEPKNQPVFVHCEHGKDRTGLIIALYRVKYEGWEIDVAYQEWIEHGHGLLLFLSDELDQYFFKKAAQFENENKVRKN